MASFEEAVQRLRAAAEPTRLRMLRLLETGEFNVKDLTELLGQSQPRVSRHIKLLADAGLIERHQEGSWVFVRASADPKIRQFIAAIFAMIRPSDAQLARDALRAEQIRARRAEAAQRYFDANAADWDRIRALHIPEQEVEAAMLSALGEGPFDLLIDAGTGTGRILELFASRAERLIGIDTNREMLRYARSRLDAAGKGNCSVRLGDIYNLPFAESVADAIVLHQVLHFLERPAAALTEAVRVLKQGGRLLIVDFAPHGLEFLRHDHAHVRLGFSASEVAGWLAEAGMSDIGYRELGAATGGGAMDLTVAIWLGRKQAAADFASARKWKVAS